MSTGKIFSPRHFLRAMKFSRDQTNAICGIETPSGIYYIKQKIKQFSKTPECFQNKTLNIIMQKSPKHVHQNLKDLSMFSKQYLQKDIHSKRITEFNGFMLHGDTYRPACVYLSDSAHQFCGEFENQFDITTLYCSDNNITLQKATENDISDEGFEIVLSNDHHPLFDCKKYCPTYTSYEQMLTALQNMKDFEGVQDVLKIYPELFTSQKYVNVGDKELKNHFIVVEGLDGTGKSTMLKNLAKYFNGVSMATPPKSIDHIRKKFDQLPELSRRSFYSLSNYLVGKDVVDITDSAPVIMDRYWHSTTSYAIAKNVGCGIGEYLPEQGHSLYKWPADLLQPTAVVFLTTPEEERDSRVNERTELTVEEREISESSKFRSRIMEVYRRIGHPKWVEVDTRGTIEESLQKAIEGLKNHGIE